MADVADFLDLLRCPDCRAPLERAAVDALACRGCASRYPITAGLPWLYRDVAGSRAQWAAKLQHFRAQRLAERARLDAGLARGDLLETTRERLRRQRAGAERLVGQIFALLEPFAFSHEEMGAGDAAGPPASDAVGAATMLRDRIPSLQHVTSYLETAFRDWVWGEAEVRATMDLAEPLLGGLEAGAPALVLGGGAGRFAWELARARPAARVLQLDLNPVLTRIAGLVVGGGSVTLTERPRFPLSVEDAAVDHVLAAPADGPVAPPGLVLGDLFAPPFAEGTFSLLVTPWVVDVLPEAFPGLARRLGGLLRDGGRWVGFGPLSFESQALADRFTPEEMVEVLEAEGFAVEQAGTESVPYLHSPHDMARRGEEIFAFTARRRGALQPAPPFALHPEWLRDGRRAIPTDPRLDAMRAARTFDLEILKCIDGRASIEDIVVILSARYGLPRHRCRNAVLRFFVRWLETGEGDSDGVASLD